MHIGVFGDSFADADCKQDIWWRVLEQQFGHQVTCHGQGGSSIEYSAELLEKYNSHYDFIIWCLTFPGRVSIQTADGYFHAGNLAGAQKRKELAELDIKVNAGIAYANHVYEYHTANRIYHAAANGFLQRYPNLMIIPCFNYPLNLKFDLFSLSIFETSHFFPGVPFTEVTSTYIDMRPGHLTPGNNKILAQLINDNLTPGIFQVEYNNFPLPTVLSHTMFKIK